MSRGYGLVEGKEIASYKEIWEELNEITTKKLNSLVKDGKNPTAVENPNSMELKQWNFLMEMLHIQHDLWVKTLSKEEKEDLKGFI